MGWDYYIFTILQITYEKNNVECEYEYVLTKQKKYFTSYNGDIDSDESGYEQDIHDYYDKQLKKYDKTIVLFDNSQFVKQSFQKKYEDDIIRCLPHDAVVIKVIKTKYAHIAL